MEQMVTVEEVRNAYRLILGREPETENVLIRHTQQTHSLKELGKKLLSSPEFRRSSQASQPQRPLNWPPIEVEVNASHLQLSVMMSHIEANWQNLGLSEPHWSVLSQEAFRSSNIVRTEERFYESGKNRVEGLQRTAERCRISLTGFKRCFELGCGVGRLSVWLADLFEEVVAADISPSHLALAQQTLGRFERTNVNLVHLDSFGALEAIPEFDVFFSIIVLQHNPPPLIAATLKTVLNRLRPGGIAYFQVPTYRTKYRFRIDEYLRNASPSRGMEMHVIPQHVLFDILRQAGCQLLEFREDGSTGNYETISNSILARKQEHTASTMRRRHASSGPSGSRRGT
jgi:SAM-dependent methyltransferase